MHVRRDSFNSKRRILSLEELADTDLVSLGKRVAYCGNPVHKKNPEYMGRY